MGSEKYKSPNEYMQFISENGGQTNAYTAAQQTTYLFSINSDKFPDALDRLSSAIKAPLFNGDMVEKEINAVNSEWLLRRQSEPFIRSRAAAMTGNLNHPRILLGVGNKETLSAKRDTLLKSLNFVQGVVEKKNTLPILSNVLLQLRDKKLSYSVSSVLRIHAKVLKND